MKFLNGLIIADSPAQDALGIASIGGEASESLSLKQVTLGMVPPSWSSA
jgi:hypothetical protein